MSPFLEIKNISKTFDPELPEALTKINANLQKGQIVGLVGPDGAGKTTLLRLITALLLPTQGEIRVGNLDTKNDAQQIQEITSYMPQRFGLYEDLTVMENLNLYANLRGVDKEKKEEQIEKLLKFASLTPFTKRLAGALSGGMKQKLGLSCALIKKPELLLLDEPGVGVDPISRRELWEMVHGLLDQNILIIWSTAYLNEAEKCDSVLLLNQGKLLFSGHPKELTEKPKGRVFYIENQKDKRSTLTQLEGIDNVLDCVIQGDKIRVMLKEPGKLDSFELKETAPRFEDAFIDILGGNPLKKSALAEAMPKIKNPIEVPIVAEGLTKRFGNFTAARNISFKVSRGEIFGLLGPNGAGKSTTFKMLCGLLKPSEGEAKVSGIDLKNGSSQARSHIGYMAQKFSLYGNLTIQQNLDFFAGIYNLKPQERKEAIDRMGEIFSLNPKINQTCDSLPLGFKQRLSMAAATMHWPSILFLDEPTSGMDPISRREFWMHINGMAIKGCTVMVTTHFMEEAENCDRIALIYRGKIIHLDRPDALKEIAKTENNQSPSLDDAFIKLIKEYDEKNPS